MRRTRGLEVTYHEREWDFLNQAPRLNFSGAMNTDTGE